MEKDNRLGGWLSIIGGTIGILGTYLVFLNWYERGLTAEAAEPGCEILLKYLMPGLGDLGILAGVLYLVAAYGFFSAAAWAFPFVIVANVLALQGSWFINVPFMAAGLPPVYFTIFFPNLILFFLLTRMVGHTPWSRILLAFLTGMAFIMCFMNGVASTSRIITIGDPIFVAVQRLNWVASLGFGVITVGILLKPMEWMRAIGISAGLLELVVGIPLVVSTTIQLERFSLFTLGPIISLILVVILAWPGMWERLTAESERIPQPQVA